MIRVAIVDDEQYHRDLIKRHIARLEKDIPESIEVYAYESGQALLDDIDRKFHIIFLDQKMSGLSGVKTAEQIRKNDKAVIIIFVTALEELWEDGYGVQAFYYLTKPIDDRKFARVFHRAVHKVIEERKPITIMTVGGIVVFDIYDIIYLIKNQRHTDIYYYDRKTKKIRIEKIKNAIRVVARQFSEYDFVRPHVSYLVNPLHIRRIIEKNRDKYLELVTGDVILISRDRINSVYESVMRSLNKRTMMVLPDEKRPV
jgi:DNA-binding LytR/AlgR family response regulator